jgi:hypothetical protein
MYHGEKCGILVCMGFKTAMETGNTGIGGKAALDRDRRRVEQGDETIALLQELVVEQKRTNQLLEWLGQERRPA